jgi:N-acetylmuramoyl-L-alanine amidase
LTSGFLLGDKFSMIFTRTDLKTNPLNCLALCIYSEARGEPDSGKYWVGSVVLNRVADKRFPDTVFEVVFQKSQFSWTIGKLSFVVKEPIAWQKCLDIAKAIMDRKSDITDNALYFLTVNLNTSWSRKLKVRKIIGNHKFLGY